MSNLPSTPYPDQSLLAATVGPSWTYKLDLQSKRVLGMVDGLEAVTQAVYKILYTERFAWLIYNWDYGAEIERYLGLDKPYVKADIQQAITEALFVDDRILRIENFEVEDAGLDALRVSFLVVSHLGVTPIDLEVAA